MPTTATIEGGTYPLARPLFIYVNRSRLARPEVAALVKFYLENAPKLVAEVGYVSYPASLYQEQLGKVK
jgi:phosphate transport system substrate-binding protein